MMIRDTHNGTASDNAVRANLVFARRILPANVV
jgi:hypothetical protein